MSILFTPGKLGKLNLKNRFIHSATYECMAKPSGAVSDGILKRYNRIAKGETGLIIPGYFFVHPLGKAMKYQMGIHSDEMIPGLKKLVDAVHQEDGKIVFQIAHSGRQTNKATIGQNPMGPSSVGRDPVNFVKPDVMSEEKIREVIDSFASAAKRAVEAGADGIQLHCAHGYLINQFLSPYFNQRDDQWGGSDENRFRFLKEILTAIKQVVSERYPILVKLNTNDFTPKQGVTPELAVKYSQWLAELGIDGLEVSCGSAIYSFMNMCRGEVPVKEIASTLPWWMRPLVKLSLNRMAGHYDFEEGYNLEAAKMIKPATGDLSLCLVGGMRSKKAMEEVLEGGLCDFISLSRPFIREPMLVKRMKEGKTESVACESCNKCLAAVSGNIAVRCYCSGFPKK